MDDETQGFMDRMGFIPTTFFRVMGSTFRSKGQERLALAKRFCYRDQSPPVELEAEAINPAYPRICAGCPRQGDCSYETTGGCAVRVLLGVGVDPYTREWKKEFVGYVPKAQEIHDPEIGGITLLRSVLDKGKDRLFIGVDWIASAGDVEESNLGCQLGATVQSSST